MKKTALVLTLVICMLCSLMPAYSAGATVEVVLDGMVGITDMGEYYADVSIENPVQNAVLMVALYQDKVLTGQEHIFLTAASKREQVFVEAPVADKAKFFVFENWENMKPLGVAKEVAIPETPDYIVTTDGANLTGTYHNVVIAPQIADGEVTLNGATVNGDLTVYGGGSNSIHLNNCTIDGKVVVEKEGGEPPRLNLIGTTLERVEVKSETLIEGEGSIRKVIATANVVADSSVVRKIEIPSYTENKVDITLDGTNPVDVEVNTSVGVEVAGGNATISTALEEAPSGVVNDGETVTHLHKWGEPKTIAPTCETSGEVRYSCVDEACSASKTEVIPALGHKYGDWTKLDATHHVHICDRDSSHLEKQEHKWDDGVTVKESTKEEEGLKKFTCIVCGETKEETIPVLSDVEFGFSRDQYGNVIVSWTNNDYPNYYYEWEDANGKMASNGWSEPGKNYATLLSLPSPNSGTETYSFVLYAADEDYNADWDNEFARLDDCAEITISGDAFPYSMNFHQEPGKHILTTGADIPANANQMGVWYINGRRAGVSAGRSSSVKKAGVQETYNNDRVKDGDSFDFRLANVEIADTRKITATMTPPSQKTYKEGDDTIFTFMESDGLKLAWKDAGLGSDEKYYVTLNSLKNQFSTSKTFLPLGAFLAREDVRTGTIVASINKGTDWNQNTELYPQTEVAKITLNRTNPDISLERNEDGTYRFHSNPVGGALVYAIYDEYDSIVYIGNTVNNAIDPYAAFKNGNKIMARHLTWTLNEDKTFAEISLSNLVECQCKDEGLMLIQDGAFLRLTWPDYGCVGYSVGVDKGGSESLYSYSGDTTEVSSLGRILPMPESGENIYDFVLYEEDSSGNILRELDRIEDALKISVTGEPLPYEIAYDTPEAGTHTLTFDLTGYAEGSGLRYTYRSGNGVRRGYRMNVSETETINADLQNGFSCDYRVISPMEFTNQSITMTMSPPSKKTYTEEESKLSFRKWNTDIMFDGYDDVADTKSLEVDGVKVVSSTRETMSEFLFDYDQTKGNIADADFVVELDGVEKERIKGNVDVTLSNTDFAFTINTDGTLSFDTTTHGSFAYETTKDGKTNQVGRIAFNNGTLVAGWDLPTLSDGETIDIMHIDCTYDATTKAISATISKHTCKTYTYQESAANTANARLVMDGDYLCLVFDDEAGLDANEWYYVFQNGEQITSDSVQEIELTWLLPGIEEDVVLDYEIQKGTWVSKETLAKLDDAIRINITDSAPNLSLAPQADGTYKITGGGNTGYFYRVTTPEGKRLAADYTMDDTFLCSIYEGCTVELQTGTIVVAEDGCSAEIIMSPVVRIENPPLPTGLNTVVEVSNADELLDAVNRGAIAKLATDITSQGMLKFKTGAPATIDLNGHTLTAPTVRVYYGKELTIDATKDGSAIAANLLTTLEGCLTLNGGTYQNIRLNNGRKFIANGITVQNFGGSDAANIGMMKYVEINNSSCINASSADLTTGLYVWNCSEVKINNVTASSVSNWFGADISQCDAVEIIGGSFHAENSTGLRFVSCKDATINGIAASGSQQALLVQDGAVVEINGGTFISASNNIIQLSRDDSALTINEGIFTANGDGSIKKIVVMEDTNTFVINGGTFTGVTGLTYSEAANATIKGGTYSFDPTAYVESSSFVVPNGDGTFTVKQSGTPL